MTNQTTEQAVIEHPIVVEAFNFWQELAMELAQINLQVKMGKATVEQYEELTARALELLLLTEYAEEMYNKALKTFGETPYEDK